MSITATLINDDRSAERFTVELDATIRNVAARPYDVVIDDLSATGFRMTGGPAMKVGDIISIGFSGIGIQAARLTRIHENNYGCEFLLPLTSADLYTARHSAPLEPITFPSLLDQASLANAPEPYVKPYSPQTKLTLAIAIPIALWGIIVGTYLTS